MNQRMSSWILAALGAIGMALVWVAVSRWAPDAFIELPDREAVLERAYLDAERLGCRVVDRPSLEISAGLRLSSTAAEVMALSEQEPNRATRRRLWAAAPPVRFSARFFQVVGPEGNVGSLLLEYDGQARLIGTHFAPSGGVWIDARESLDMQFADYLAEMLLEAPPPPPRAIQQPGQYELVYELPGHERQPGVYVFVGPGTWLAHLQPVPYLVKSAEGMSFLRWHPVKQLQAYVLVLTGLLGLAVLLWRLTHQRAGFNQAYVLMTLLLLGLVPVVGHYSQGDPRLLGALWLYLVLNQVGVWLGWAAGEAELREVRPGAVDSWDRMVRWKPVASNGRDLLQGLVFGCALGGALAASGELLAGARGGYGSFLVVLPDYWSLPTPLNWGLALTAVTSLLVSFGGRLGGRPGAMVGAATSAAAWSLVVPVAPLSWALGVGLACAMAAGWVVWHYGLLPLAVTAVTALSLPTLLVSWRLSPWLLETSLLSSLPLLLLPLGLALSRWAPRRRDGDLVAPTYVSSLEQKAKLDGEVELLRGLQLSLLPPEDPPAPVGIDLAWKMIPADSVGGDFLDLDEDADGRLWLAIADVAGHGIACSVLTAFTKAAVAQHAVAGVGPAEALRQIRQLFGRLRSSRTLVTLLLAVWEPETRRLRVASAGHPPLLLFDGSTVQEVGRPGGPLGSPLPSADGEVQLECPGESLLVGYSDGVVEALSPRGDTFTYDRWPGLLPQLASLPPKSILAELLRDLDLHCAGRPAEDDVTALVIKLSC